MITESPKGELVVSPCPSNKYGDAGVGFATYRQNGAVFDRVRSVKLPTRATRLEAERDLLAWLEKRICRARQAEIIEELCADYERLVKAPEGST